MMIGRCSRVHRLTSGNAPAAGDGGGYDDDAMFNRIQSGVSRR